MIELVEGMQAVALDEMGAPIVENAVSENEVSDNSVSDNNSQPEE